MDRFAVALVGLLVCAVAGAPAAAHPFGPADVGSADASESFAALDGFDRTEFHITVHSNGSARWTFAYMRSLGNETERREFRAFAREFRNGSLQMYDDFRSKAESLTAAASDHTGRNMTATAFSKDATVTGLSDNEGVVRMSFRWTNFGRVDGDRVVVGDVFDGGLYVGGDQRLVVEAGDGLAFAGVEPNPTNTSNPGSLVDSDTVTWVGERTFTDEHPHVELAPRDAIVDDGTTTTTSTTTTIANATTTADRTTTANAAVGQGGGGNLPWLVAGLVVVLLAVGAAALWHRSDRGAGAAVDADEPDDGAAPDGAAAAVEPAVSDEEMLTDEERVLRMLRENGGRMRQVNIVEETGWSKSKVSMLLSEMEEENQVSKLRVGRENIVSLPGHEPDASGSALD